MLAKFSELFIWKSSVSCSLADGRWGGHLDFFPRVCPVGQSFVQRGSCLPMQVAQGIFPEFISSFHFIPLSARLCENEMKV